ncbi:sugar transporter [Lactiplantibacillus garii]|uniref:Sugar transporter n=1 Tax=Lactiplantibacillus garii TaxID=2306423 RepID=A0A426D9Y3_9LACO|nr:GRP family sugar transporter [Lactiplantibacillus garii]RRK11356.1 sugar transporter [Lactiplantibacillus garii]
MGILLALIPALGWGVQPLIARKIGGRPTNQIFGTGLGALLIGLVVLMGAGTVTDRDFAISFLAGLLWSIGQVGQFVAFTKIGVTRTMPVSTGLQVVGTSLIGVLIFGEWPGTAAKLIGLLAIILVVVGVTLTTVTDQATGGSSLKSGLLILVPTTVGYLAYSALPKALPANGLQLFFPEMLGIFVGALLYNLCTTQGRSLSEKTSWQNVLIGLIFGVSSLAYIFAAKLSGIATVFVITQLNVVVSTVGALVILHEAKTNRELKATLTGLGLIVIGSVLTATL